MSPINVLGSQQSGASAAIVVTCRNEVVGLVPVGLLKHDSKTAKATLWYLVYGWWFKEWMDF